jgi:hypothetical protein
LKQSFYFIQSIQFQPFVSLSVLSMKDLALYVIFAYALYHFFIDEETGCEKYASKFSCKFVEKKAQYDVYYWHKVKDGNPSDEKLIGSTVGLEKCRDLAFTYAITIDEKWNYRSYVCILTKEGNYLEKHRLISE